MSEPRRADSAQGSVPPSQRSTDSVPAGSVSMPCKRRSHSSDGTARFGAYPGRDSAEGPALPPGARVGSAGTSTVRGMHLRGRSYAGPGGGPQTYERHTADVTRAMVEFLTPMLPTEEEYRIKEATRRQLERLAERVSPGARLLAFGSMANGFALRNSDMDLCCLLQHDAEHEQKSPSELVEILGELIRQETDFHVLPLPKARIPIIKISRPASGEVPYDIACDIGFDNQLALENTRLLLSYAMVDPPRLRSLVLFLKVWTKRRKLNSPFTGTLSSYGFTLLALFFLIHVKRPQVLPNLQRIPAGRPLRPDEVELEGHNIYFYDDIETLRKEWSSDCHESIGELLLDFFRYFSRDFHYAKDAISLHTEAGLVSKESRGWSGEHLCIEDPFQHGYNVSRTVTKDGLYTIRGEFMRAGRLLANRSARAPQLLAELCEEREDGLTRAPDFHGKRNEGARSLGRAPNAFRERHEPFRGAAMDDMARSLGSQVYPPAMLAPLAHTHNLTAPGDAPLGYIPAPYAVPLVPGTHATLPYTSDRPSGGRSLSDTPSYPSTPSKDALDTAPAPTYPTAHPAPSARSAPPEEVEGELFSMSPDA